MPIPRYGVWKATPTAWNGRANNDHGHITFSDGTSNNLDAAVNVQSSSADTRLVYWLLRDFDKTHPIAKKLAALKPGYQAQKGANSLGLDFLRDNFLNINDGILVSHNAPGSGSDILDYLDPILNQAVATKATIYIYGSKYDGHDGDGIHDIHMNQGNSGRFANDNGSFQDGGIIMEFADGHWEGIFLAFAVQAYETDDRGYPKSTNSPTLAKLLSGHTSPPPPASDGQTGEIPPVGGHNGDTGPGEGEAGVSIQAAVINPVGPDQNPTSGDGEALFLLNRSAASVSLEGWSISNAAGQTQSLPAGSELFANSKAKFPVPSCPLSNKGGHIILRDPNGSVVDEVSYSKEQAKREGVLVYFQQKS